MILMNLSKVKKAFGEAVLFDDVSFSIDERDKIGFVGANGAGKTTLLKLMLEELDTDGGEIFRNRLTKIGYMQQQTNLTSDRTAMDELMTVFAPLRRMEEELEEIASKLERGEGDPAALAERQHALQRRYEDEGGLTYRSTAKASLLGLGFREQELWMDFANLSGGQKTRIFLCKILLSQANLLFLDEPTNHLDIASVEWLESFLRDYKGAFVVISHDRYFLDRVANRIFELENGRLTVYKGNYTEYVRQKAEARKTQERQYENTMREINRLEGIVEQQRRWNREKNIKTAESKQKGIERLEQTLVRPEQTPEGIRFAFSARQTGGNDVLECRELAMRFGEKRLFEDVSLHLRKGEHVFLLGPNGCGKTTLFRLILGELAPTAGSVKLGANIQIGYYDQTQDHLDYGKTVLDEVADAYPELTQTQLRCALAAFLFRGEDVFKSISELSGGERAKVALLELMLSGANLLLLDEPTNHLDISSREALEEALAGYGGTLLVVSHDRYFVNKLASRVMAFGGRRLENYLGNYDYYLEKRKDIPPETEHTERPAAGREEYLRKKQEEAQERKRQSRVKRLEEQIAEKEERNRELLRQLEQPEVAADYQKASELTGELETLEAELSALYEEWDSLS